MASTSFTQGFFQNKNQTPHDAERVNKQPLPLSKKPKEISTKGRGDVACAVALIDLFLSPGLRGNDRLASTLLDQLFNDFPDYPRPASVPNYLLPSKYMQQICLHTDHQQRLIESLSFTLRRIALETIMNNPLYYRCAFLHPTKPLSVSALLNDPQSLNLWISDALLHTLSLKLPVLEISDHKTLARQLSWSNSPSGQQTHLIMSWQHQTCLLSTQVEYSEWFSSFHADTLNIPSFSNETMTSFAKQADQQVLSFKEDASLMIQKYQSTQRRLKHMIIKKELSEADILLLYRETINPLSPMLPQKKRMNAEYGNQQHFEQLSSFYPLPKHNPSPINNLILRTVDALARAIALGDTPDFTQKMRHQHETPCLLNSLA
jgi:hypothetical protein